MVTKKTKQQKKQHDNINQKITMLDIHLEEVRRCRDDIQLLEVPILLPCPCPRLEGSADKSGFKEFLFEVPSGKYEVEGILASPKIYQKENNY